MKKHDLGLFMLVEYRRGDVRMVVSDYNGDLLLANGDSLEPLGNYDNNLIHRSYAELDIVRVFDCSTKPQLILSFDTSNRELLWERNGSIKVKEMTVDEVSKALGFKVKIV